MREDHEVRRGLVLGCLASVACAGAAEREPNLATQQAPPLTAVPAASSSSPAASSSADPSLKPPP